MLRELYTVRSYFSEDYASPEPPFIQKLQGLVYKPNFCGHRLQFIQVDTLDKGRFQSVYVVSYQTRMYFVTFGREKKGELCNGNAKPKKT